MGKEVEKAAIARGHEIVFTIDNETDWQKFYSKPVKADVAIDFSMPSVAVYNMVAFFKLGIPVIIGTTGWDEKYEEVKEICLKNKSAFMYSSNFSIGVNLLFSLNTKLAEMMKTLDQYDVSIEEIHHLQKLDSPSGTAITLANQIISKIDRKKKWVNKKSSINNFLEIKSVRKDNIVGIHHVIYTSENDELSISHNAKNRSGFAIGAVMAAEWIQGETGVFTMNDMLNL